MDYSKFPSMITKSSELVLGLVYYHVYGHILGVNMSQEEVIREPYKDEYNNLCFDYRANRINRSTRHCLDCGLDGANYNHNRIFKDASDAGAFIKACVKESIAQAINNRYHDH